MNYTILIADDEPEIRTLLRLYLENENYQIIEAENGKQAPVSYTHLTLPTN